MICAVALRSFDDTERYCAEATEGRLVLTRVRRRGLLGLLRRERSWTVDAVEVQDLSLALSKVVVKSGDVTLACVTSPHAAAWMTTKVPSAVRERESQALAGPAKGAAWPS